MSTTYVYTDEKSRPCYQIVVDRTNPNEKRVWQQRLVDGVPTNGMEGVTRFPFRLPQLIDAVERDETVFICEGEKDVMRLVELGCVATTNSGGAGNWLPEYARWLAGARVIVVGDIDEAGRRHVQQVVASLLEHGDLESIKVVDLATLGIALPPKGDISDYLDAEGQLEDIVLAADNAPELVTHSDELLEFPSVDVNTLPALLRQIVATENDPQDRTTLLLSCAVTLGSFMTTVSMRVAGRNLNPSLYFMMIGGAANGKGLALISRDLVNDIHQDMREQYKLLVRQHEQERAASLASDPKAQSHLAPPPRQLSLILPGNSTAPVIIEAMIANASSLIHETEADVTATMLKSDYGDLSGVLRQSYTHEPVSFGRKHLNEILEVNHPRLALCISSTQGQVSSFFRDAENGLLSRFIFHFLPRRSKFKDPFDNRLWNGQSYGKIFAPRVATLYKALTANKESNIEVRFTQDQLDRMRPILETQDALADDDGNSYTAAVRRNPILIARLAMVLTIARFISIDGDDHLTAEGRTALSNPNAQLMVSNDDFTTALELARYALRTAQLIGRLLPEFTQPSLRHSTAGVQAWYESLPPEFKRQHACELGLAHGLSSRTVDRKLAEPALFHQEKHGHYKKNAYGKVAI
jgi:hypothetical protein